MSEFWRTEITHEAAAMLEELPADTDLYGVEVGVLRCKTACIMLHRLPDLRLVLVDTWEEESEGPTGEAVLHEAIRNLRPFWDRVVIVKMDSTSAADLFDHCWFDYVLVDADHYYPKCKHDMEAWWERLKPGGVMFHHDIDHPKFPGWGVRRAVEEFCEERGLEFRVNDERWMATITKPSG